MHKYVSYGEKKNYIKAPQIVGNLFQKFKRKCEGKKWCEKIGERKWKNKKGLN